MGTLGSGVPLNGPLTPLLAHSLNITLRGDGVIIDGDEGFSFGELLRFGHTMV